MRNKTHNQHCCADYPLENPLKTIPNANLNTKPNPSTMHPSIRLSEAIITTGTNVSKTVFFRGFFKIIFAPQVHIF